MRSTTTHPSVARAGSVPGAWRGALGTELFWVACSRGALGTALFWVAVCSRGALGAALFLVACSDADRLVGRVAEPQGHVDAQAHDSSADTSTFEAASARDAFSGDAILVESSVPLDAFTGGAAEAATDAAVDGPSDGPDVALLPFGKATVISSLLVTDLAQQDPTLTQDEREIYFTATRAGGEFDIWTSTRATTADPWGMPFRVAELSTTSVDSSPEIAADGLTLYFASNRDGDSNGHLYRSQRPSLGSAWATPVRVTAPSPATQDDAPALDNNGLWLAFASVRDTSNFDLYLARRASTADPWGAPTTQTVLNSAANDWDPALYFGATQIIFASQRNDDGDLYQASRPTTRDPFSPPSPVTELNTTGSEGDPWVSADGHRIYFASNRSGGPHLYYAER